MWYETGMTYVGRNMHTKSICTYLFIYLYIKQRTIVLYILNPSEVILTQIFPTKQPLVTLNFVGLSLEAIYLPSVMCVNTEFFSC